MLNIPAKITKAHPVRNRCSTIIVLLIVFVSDVEPELLKETGACLHLTVMDYDVFSNDDIAGHAYFNLNNIQGLCEVVTGGFGSIPQETCNIFHPKPEGQYFEGKESLLSNFIIHSKYFPDSDWLKAHA